MNNYKIKNYKLNMKVFNNYYLNYPNYDLFYLYK